MHVDHLPLPPPQREPVLSGPQRKFCEGVVAGLNQTEAYQAAYPRAGYDTARAKASALVTKDNIRSEIQRLRAKADAMAGSAVMTLLEKRMFLARVVRAHVALLPADSDLWTATGRCQLRIADKLAAIKLDNDLAGDGDGGAVELVATLGGDADPFSEMLLSIRQ